MEEISQEGHSVKAGVSEKTGADLRGEGKGLGCVPGPGLGLSVVVICNFLFIYFYPSFFFALSPFSFHITLLFIPTFKEVYVILSSENRGRSSDVIYPRRASPTPDLMFCSYLHAINIIISSISCRKQI